MDLVETIIAAVARHYEITTPLDERNGFKSDWDYEPEYVLAALLWTTGMTKKAVAEVIGRSASSDVVGNANKITGFEHVVRALTHLIVVAGGHRLGRCRDCQRAFIATGKSGKLPVRCAHCRHDRDREMSRARALRSKANRKPKPVYVRPQSQRKKITRVRRESKQRPKPATIELCGCGQDYMTLPIDHHCTEPREIPAWSPRG